MVSAQQQNVMIYYFRHRVNCKLRMCRSYNGKMGLEWEFTVMVSVLSASTSAF